MWDPPAIGGSRFPTIPWNTAPMRFPGLVSVVVAVAACAHPVPVPGPFDALFAPSDGRFLHVSSTDTTGGNNDRLEIAAGDSAVLLDLAGAGVIRRIWFTVGSADPHYLRRIAIKMYWDGETNPSVEAPLGDFFGDGFAKPNYTALVMGVSSGGFFCYLPMPFRRHARIVVENGTGKPVDAFYYNIDLVQLDHLPPDIETFHAWWHRDATPSPTTPHLILAARGRGKFIGTSLNAESYGGNFWFLEGDEIFHVDGTLRGQGTGTEDYFNSGWYFDRGTFAGPFHGLLEKNDSLGRIAAYRWHIPDPIPFQDSIRIEIEHGTQNEEVADYATMAYWYQTEPHAPLAPLPPPDERRVLGVKIPADATRPGAFVISRYPDATIVKIGILRPDRYDVTVYPVGSPAGGRARYAFGTDGCQNCGERYVSLAEDGANTILPPVSLGVVSGHDSIAMFVDGPPGIVPAAIEARPVRTWATDWNVVGPFPSPRTLGSEHAAALDSVYGPERNPDLIASYDVLSAHLRWDHVRAGPEGRVRLIPLFDQSDWVAAYVQTFLYSPDARDATLLLGADDAHQLWVNGALVSQRQGRHTDEVDDVAIPVHLHAGWNRVLLKDANLDGGWEFRLRAADPDGVFRWSRVTP